MSDCVLGLARLPRSAVASSGAAQRIEPPPGLVEPVTENMPSAIEERPKSARQGLPSLLIRILCYRRSWIVRTNYGALEEGGEIPRTPFKSP